MACRFIQLVIDCKDPESLAGFWREVLGYEDVDRDPDGVWAEIKSPDDTGPLLFFLKVPEDKVVKNRLHIDVSPTDRDRADETERILALGATKVDVGQSKADHEVTWDVLQDPEGNEFCVLRRGVEA